MTEPTSAAPVHAVVRIARLRDRCGTNTLGVKAVVECVRIVRTWSVSINGKRYSGKCLIGHDGETFRFTVNDCYASEYEMRPVDQSDGRRFGTVKEQND